MEIAEAFKHVKIVNVHLAVDIEKVYLCIQPYEVILHSVEAGVVLLDKENLVAFEDIDRIVLSINHQRIVGIPNMNDESVNLREFVFGKIEETSIFFGEIVVVLMIFDFFESIKELWPVFQVIAVNGGLSIVGSRQIDNGKAVNVLLHHRGQLANIFNVCLFESVGGPIGDIRFLDAALNTFHDKEDLDSGSL